MLYLYLLYRIVGLEKEVYLRKEVKVKIRIMKIEEKVNIEEELV